jgi:hypothetical protein
MWMYRYSISLSLCFLLFSSFSEAQPEIALSKTIGGNGIEFIHDMIADEQGNLIALCLIDSFNQDVACEYKGGGTDIWIVKMDASGNILWQKCVGGSDAEFPYQIIQTQDGGFLFVATTFSNDGDVSFNHGGTDIWLVKTDTLGNIEWDKSIGSSSSESPYDLNQLTDGSFVLAAYSLGSNGDFPAHYGGLNDDAWLVFVTNAGELDTTIHFGGTDDDYITEILELGNGDLQLFGTTASVDFDLEETTPFGFRDAWAIRTNSLGEVKWMKRWGGNFSDAITGAVNLYDGGFLTAGSSSSNLGDYDSNHGESDVWVMRLDSTANVLVNKLLGGSGDDVTGFRRRIHEAGNSIFTIGARTLSWDGDVGLNIGYNDFWFLTIDTNCNLISSKVSGGSNEDLLESSGMINIKVALQAGITYSNDFDIVDFGGEADGWFIKIDGITLTGTIQPRKSVVIVYPNPLKESFTVFAEDQSVLKNAVLDIYSLDGTLLIRKKIKSSDETISVRGLSPGIYQCIISSKEDIKVASVKLVVQ